MAERRALLLGMAALAVASGSGAMAQQAGGNKDAVRPKSGLLHRYSRLPATLPLGVLSDPGTDHRLTLVVAETQEVILTAYVRGGTPFRVLVPPGTFRLHVLSGRVWQGERDGFAETIADGWLKTPLEFGAGFAHRRGVMVDLRGEIGDQIEA